MTDTSRKRQPRGIPVGGQFAANDHDEANGVMGASVVPETAEQIQARYEKDAAETRAVIESYVESGFLKKSRGNPTEYETEDIFIGRTADGGRMFVSYRAQFDDRTHGSMEDPSVQVSPVRFSMTGSYYEKGSRAMTGGGQNYEDLDQIVESKDSPYTTEDAAELRGLWTKNHLNDMNAGTHAQTAIIDSMTDEEKGSPLEWYNNVTARLESEGMLVDGDYKYGSRWLSRSVPASDVSRTLELLSRGGRR